MWDENYGADKTGQTARDRERDIAGREYVERKEGLRKETAGREIMYGKHI